MIDKIKTLLKSESPEDRLIACSLLVENHSVTKFIRDWQNDDPSIYKFKADGKEKRPGILFVEEEEMEEDESQFYYHYKPKRWLLCNKFEIVVCYEVYAPNVKIIEHE